ncbi:MAG: hypothetical protein ACSHXD_14845 [Marinosulfonomonas sp.]
MKTTQKKQIQPVTTQAGFVGTGFFTFSNFDLVFYRRQSGPENDNKSIG